MPDLDKNRKRLEQLYRMAVERAYAPLLDEVSSTPERMSPSELDSYQEKLERAYYDAYYPKLTPQEAQDAAAMLDAKPWRRDD